MAYKLFVDTNVYLDFLMQRGKDWENAEAIFKLAEKGVIEVFTSSSSVINLMYIMGSYKVAKQEIVTNTYAILSYTKLINPDNSMFETALSSAFKDLEDAVQYYTALQIRGMSYFITTNAKDYKNSMGRLQAITPREFMERYNK